MHQSMHRFKLIRCFTLFLCIMACVLCGQGSGDVMASLVKSRNSSELHVIVFVDITGQFKSWPWAGNVALMAIAEINKREDILPGITLVPHFVDTKCQSGAAIDGMFKVLYEGPPIPLIVGAICSVVCMSTAELSNRWNINQVTGSCVDPSLSDKQKYPRFFRTATSDTHTVTTRIQLMEHFHWEKIALFHEPRGPFPMVTEHMTEQLAETTMTILTTESVGTSPRQQIKSLMSHDSRIIIGGVYPNQLQRFFCEVYKMEFYGPHITWMLPGWYDAVWFELFPHTHDCSPEQILEVVQDILYLDNAWTNMVDVDGLMGHNQSEMNEIVAEWVAAAPVKPSIPFGAAATYDAIVAAALGLNNTQAELERRGVNRSITEFTYGDQEIADILTESLQNVSFQGVKGFIQFDENHDVESDGLIYQQKGREKRLVGWHKRHEKEIVWLNGGITWTRGVAPVDHTLVIPTTVYLSQGLYITVCSVAVVGIIICLGFISFNTYYRNLRVIKMSSPNINTLILVGCIISYISVVFVINESTIAWGQIICILRSAVFVIGFSLTFGGLFAKTWRVHIILTKSLKTAKRTIISDARLFSIVGGLVLVDVIVLMTWQLYDPYRLEYKNLTQAISTEDLYGETLIIYQIPNCASEYKTYFQGALFVVQGAMLAFGAFLAWETRKVKLAALNDSKWIGVCIYNVAILSIIGAAISMVITDNPDAGYGFTSTFLIAGTTLVSTVLFVPKILIKQRGDVAPTEADTLGTGGTTDHSVTTVTKATSHTSDRASKH